MTSEEGKTQEMTDENTFDLHEARLRLLDHWLQYLLKPTSANNTTHPPNTHISLKESVFSILNPNMSFLESRDCSHQRLFAVTPLCLHVLKKEPGILLCVESASVRQVVSSVHGIFIL
jgi:hypothetical protein